VFRHLRSERIKIGGIFKVRFEELKDVSPIRVIRIEGSGIKKRAVFGGEAPAWLD